MKKLFVCFLGLVVVFSVAMAQGANSLFSQNPNTLTPEQRQDVIDRVKEARDSGGVADLITGEGHDKESGYIYATAWIPESVWVALNIREKEKLGTVLALYCAIKRNDRNIEHYRIDIKGWQSGMKIATVSWFPYSDPEHKGISGWWTLDND